MSSALPVMLPFSFPQDEIMFEIAELELSDEAGNGNV